MKVIIIGKGDGWNLAPQDGETWGVNDLLTRRDVKQTFQFHDPKDLNAKELEALEKVKQLGIPCWMPEVYPEVPTSRRYPLLEIVKEFKTSYFNNSIGYMIALAIYQGATSIELYGVNMCTDSEYSDQKGCVEFWLGVAMGRDIRVRVYGVESEILICRGAYGRGMLYGYGTPQGNCTGRLNASPPK